MAKPLLAIADSPIFVTIRKTTGASLSESGNRCLDSPISTASKRLEQQSFTDGSVIGLDFARLLT